jgi:hypothetical protein
MKEVIEKFIELAESDRDVLKALKDIAVDKHEYLLCSDLRAMEIKKYPEAATTNKEFKEATTFEVFLRLVGLRGSVETAYTVLECAKVFIKKKGKSDLKDASIIQAKMKKIFG